MRGTVSPRILVSSSPVRNLLCSVIIEDSLGNNKTKTRAYKTSMNNRTFRQAHKEIVGSVSVDCGDKIKGKM